MDVAAFRHVHCVGIGGIGISGVAKFLHAEGVSVSGSDAKQSVITDGCVALGIAVSIGHSAANIPSDTDLIVYTEAATEENVERIEAKSRGIAQMGHFDFLGELSKDYRTICITGTNGKSTTTAMAGKIFTDAGFDPTVFVGSIVPGWLLGNVRVGASDILIVEGDEYRQKMVKLWPETTVITNIEADHLDVYRDLDHIVQTFQQIADKTTGAVIVNGDDVNSEQISSGHRSRYGVDDAGADVFAEDRVLESGSQSFLVKRNIVGHDESLGRVRLRVPGMFNMMNALAAIALALRFGVSFDVIQSSLASFAGIWRRFERVGKFNGAQVISDYGHHPTAIVGTLAGAREFFPNSRIVLLFEPHQHNRTKELFDDFAKSFGNADVVILSEIYGVIGRTETIDASVSSKALLEAAMKSERAPKEGYYAANLIDAERMLRTVIQKDDVVIVMGAGDVDAVARNLVAGA
jgi:UDP-N-acetylmuramate--alanine ligase